MRSILLSSLFVFLGSQVHAATCPLGAKNSELTIQRVMINFGKFTSKADQIVAAGLNRPDAIADSDLTLAAADLLIAQACASAVVTGQSEALLPASVKKLAEADRDQYVTAFRQAMSIFADALSSYAQSLTELAATPAKDFSAAAHQKKIVADMADEAHAHFAN